MTDLLGPADAANAVTSRPADARVFGDDDTFFKGCSSPDANDGTEITADYLNGMLAQVRSAIDGMGVTRDNDDDDMLLTAIKLARVGWGVDSGSANAMAVTLDPAPSAYFAGMMVAVLIAETNTSTTVNLNVNGLGNKRVKMAITGDPAIGDIVAGSIGLFVYAPAGGGGFRLIARLPAPGASTPIPYQPGDIIISPLETEPTGTLECDGSAVSRSTYAALFDKIGTKYGSGNGTTTFNVPDYRGYFMRGWSHGTLRDPDKASRTNRGDGTTGDHVGTKQSDTYKSHSHSGGSLTCSDASIIGLRADTNAGTGHDVFPEGVIAGPTLVKDLSTFSITTGNAGGNETRPMNVGVMFCIAY